jgi:hypothetical protein
MLQWLLAGSQGRAEKNTHHQKGETSVAFGIGHIGGHLFIH